MGSPFEHPSEAATFIGVRHHSPACARLVDDTIVRLRPAHVLVEGPADMNDRIDELLLGHDLPVAIFTSYKAAGHAHASWTPFCAYSPEWVALTAGRAAGAEVRFIDLPAWHPALARRQNRYADAEVRYAEAVERLCLRFAVDNIDTLWDHLFEVEPEDGLAERLAAYFDLVRGEADASDDDREREAYMARWVRAALADAGGRPVVVVTGGFHRPALIRLVAGEAGAAAGPDGRWPDVPRPADGGGTAASYLVPYSFKRLDAFAGYQSGMPSPAYYQQVWEAGHAAAAAGVVGAVAAGLRDRKQPVSTADLIAASALSAGLARLRGHRHPGRTDVLDALASALVTEPLDVPLPWTTRGHLEIGTHPAVVEMVAAVSGTRVGRLHPATPRPPLVHGAIAELERHGLDGSGPVHLDLTVDADLARSRLLHRFRVLTIPGFVRRSGPSVGAEPALTEDWNLDAGEDRLVALIEAGAYGPTLEAAATALLEEAVTATSGDVEQLADVLFDAVLCGSTALSGEVLAAIAASVGTATDLGALGAVLGSCLGLWRHDRLLGAAHSPVLGAVIGAAVRRVLWLAEGTRGGPAPADVARLRALVATRDALRHAAPALGLDSAPVLDVMARLAAATDVPPDLRGAAFGFGWSLGAGGDPVRAARGAFLPDVIGDWLAGLFALAREEVLAATGPDGEELLGVLDDWLGRLAERDFLVALPALRLAFSFFPPRERERIAAGLLERRGLRGSGRALVRTPVEPALVAEGRALELRVDALLAREALLARAAEDSP